MFSLIVVDYNSIEKTACYLRHCMEMLQQEEPLHVVVVDNGSRTDGLSCLEREFGASRRFPQTVEGREIFQTSSKDLELVYCHSGDNLGYARGNNLGTKIADAVFADEYYIISNNDLVIQQPVVLTEVAACFRQHSDMGILGPRIVGLDGMQQSPRKHQSAFVKLIAWYWAMGPLKKYVDDVCHGADAGPCDWVSGSFFFVSAEAFQKAGRMDEHTFLFAEEMILSRRLHTEGYRVYYNPQWSLLHNHGQTVKKAVSVQQGFQISFDANAYYYKTYCNATDILLALARGNFWLYKNLYPCRQKLKELFRRG